ncbi:cystathionine gamma-lyase related protein [Thermoplasma acidophilum]|uniref:Cystathionine gamma-lyase related protein n=1 Tax=Thermoplasma acidophilum (strain ATCC 25905 / DSM 1728 / JCM 9062 / NBRC 15155 / AMRC-C165) TaxID=273075 RepID=Q9HLZ3_THEAC|nr:PLP-dependent transferase [Thermoplasma acidophilum]CAC11228.1 cystathionine gamma-lyase related protein [Thermoplasma acidophilum]
MVSHRYKGFNTKAVQSGELRDPRFGNVTTPIFETSTFVYPNPEKEAYTDHTRDQPYIYTRWGNPTVQAFEEKYAAVEGAEYALSFSSGMGAITSAITGLLHPGSRMLSLSDLYGQTFYFFNKVLGDLGIKVDYIDTERINSLDFDPSKYDAIYMESITNPTLKVPDIRSVSDYAKKSLVIVDATFASPYNQHPLDLGADVVIHSATKYIGGHSDIVMGVVGTNSKEIFNSLVIRRKTYGSNPDPIQAYLALRGLKTLGLRMEKHNRNGMEIATFLRKNDSISRVYYPDTEMGKKVLSGFGGMVSFEIRRDRDVHSFLRKLSIPMVAASLGGVESLITLPAETSHSSLSREERERMGISDNLVRFSIGIEDAEDLIADIQNALGA